MPATRFGNRARPRRRSIGDRQARWLSRGGEFRTGRGGRWTRRKTLYRWAEQNPAGMWRSAVRDGCIAGSALRRRQTRGIACHRIGAVPGYRAGPTHCRSVNRPHDDDDAFPSSPCSKSELKSRGPQPCGVGFQALGPLNQREAHVCGGRRDAACARTICRAAVLRDFVDPPGRRALHRAAGAARTDRSRRSASWWLTRGCRWWPPGCLEPVDGGVDALAYSPAD